MSERLIMLICLDIYEIVILVVLLLQIIMILLLLLLLINTSTYHKFEKVYSIDWSIELLANSSLSSLTGACENMYLSSSTDRKKLEKDWTVFFDSIEQESLILGKNKEKPTIRLLFQKSQILEKIAKEMLYAQEKENWCLNVIQSITSWLAIKQASSLFKGR